MDRSLTKIYDTAISAIWPTEDCSLSWLYIILCPSVPIVFLFAVHHGSGWPYQKNFLEQLQRTLKILMPFFNSYYSFLYTTQTHEQLDPKYMYYSRVHIPFGCTTTITWPWQPQKIMQPLASIYQCHLKCSTTNNKKVSTSSVGCSAQYFQ